MNDGKSVAVLMQQCRWHAKGMGELVAATGGRDTRQSFLPVSLLV